jgi:hypothetical protein
MSTIRSVLASTRANYGNRLIQWRARRLGTAVCEQFVEAKWADHHPLLLTSNGDSETIPKCALTGF